MVIMFLVHSPKDLYRPIYVIAPWEKGNFQMIKVLLDMKSEFLFILGDLIHHYATAVGTGVYRDQVISGCLSQ